jgi:hypothetical protein
MTKTAKALDVSRYTLIRYLKADEELRNSFDDVKLNEIDDVRSELVKQALSEASFLLSSSSIACHAAAFSSSVMLSRISALFPSSPSESSANAFAPNPSNPPEFSKLYSL